MTLTEKSSQNTKLSFVVTTGYRIFHFPLCSRRAGEQLRISLKQSELGSNLETNDIYSIVYTSANFILDVYDVVDVRFFSVNRILHIKVGR